MSRQLPDGPQRIAKLLTTDIFIPENGSWPDSIFFLKIRYLVDIINTWYYYYLFARYLWSVR